MKFRERLFPFRLSWQTRPAVVAEYLQSKKNIVRSNCEKLDPRQVVAGAVQLEVKLFSDVREYLDEMHRFTALAAGEGVQLLVFPELNSLQLLGLIPGISKLAQQAGTEDTAELPVTELFRLVGPVFGRIVRQTFSWLAQAYGLYIMAGSFLVPDGGRVVNRALLFDAGGRLAGFQDKVHLTVQEKKWGLTSGDSLAVFPTPLGVLAAPVCMDATYFETFRLLERQGAEIVMVPIANPEQYNFWLALRGIWPRVQESTVYGLKSALVGEFLGWKLTGRAGIFAPLELTQNKDGVLAETVSAVGEGFVTATLDLVALRQLKDNHPYLGDINPGLEQKYFPAIYSGAVPFALSADDCSLARTSFSG